MSVKNFKELLKTVKDLTELEVLVLFKDNRVYVGGIKDGANIVVGSTEFKMEKPLKFAFNKDSAAQLEKILEQDKPLSFEEVDGGVRVLHGKKRMKFTTIKTQYTMNALMSGFNENVNFTVDGNDLIDTIKRVRHFTRTNQVNDIRMKSISMFVGAKSYLCSIDGPCMAYSEMSTVKSDREYSFITNVSFENLLNIFKDAKVQVSVDNVLSIAADSETFRYRVMHSLVNQKPLDFIRLLNSVEQTNREFIELDKAELMKAIVVSDFFTDDDQREKVVINYSPDQVTLTSSNENGESEIELDLARKSVGDESFVRVRTSALLKAVRNSTEDKLKLYVAGPEQKLLINDGFCKNLIMNLKV